jgi:protein-S-isoprenylcysteine O-methyltransferase Ste14
MPRAYTVGLTLTWILAVVDGTIPSFWLCVHPFVAWWRRRSTFTLFGLGLVWIVLWAVAAGLTWPLLFQVEYHVWWSWPGGALFWVAGLALYRAAKRGFTDEQLFGRSEFRPQTAEQRLVTTGIRSHIRHPIYAGHLCLLLGSAVSSGLIANYLLLAWYLLTLPVMLHFEERELVGRFGMAYEDYKRRVPAIIPVSR